MKNYITRNLKRSLDGYSLTVVHTQSPIFSLQNCQCPMSIIKYKDYFQDLAGVTSVMARVVTMSSE